MRQLSVAVPGHLFHADPQTGAGRVWETVLPRLAGHANVHARPLGGVRRWRSWIPRGPDAWLAPGHCGSLAVNEPLVALVHGTPWTVAPEVWDLVDHGFAQRFIALTDATLSSAAHVIVPSTYARHCLQSGYDFDESQVTVVPHGVDTSVFHPGRQGGRSLVARMLGHERPYVMFASVAAPHKNLPLLMHAMDALARRGFPHALVIAGPSRPAAGDPLAEISERLSTLRDRTVWTGQVEDDRLAALMAEADAFCLPSLLDSFGLTVLEALSCGTPVVVSNRGALPEVVDGAALVIEPSATAVGAALEEILSDPGTATRLRAAGPDRARQLTWERTALGWLDAIKLAASAG
jgi:glycosyltransferase involved in cell wall biosynthesis